VSEVCGRPRSAARGPVEVGKCVCEFLIGQVGAVGEHDDGEILAPVQPHQVRERRPAAAVRVRVAIAVVDDAPAQALFETTAVGAGHVAQVLGAVELLLITNVAALFMDSGYVLGALIPRMQDQGSRNGSVSESGQSRVGRCACGGDLEDLVAGSEPGSPDDRLGGEVRGFGRTAWRQVLVLADLGEGAHQLAAHSSPAEFGTDDEAEVGVAGGTVRCACRARSWIGHASLGVTPIVMPGIEGVWRGVAPWGWGRP
jgi:hypothetical protein